MREGWEIKKLKDVCTKITDGTHQTPKYFDEGYIFLSSKNVTSGKIDWDNIKYIDEKQHLEMHKRVSPKVGDILLAKNGTTGVAAMVDRDVIFDIYVSLAHLSPLENIYSYYLLYFINSPLAKNQFNKRLKGVGVPNLHLEEIREVEIPIPPIPEQQRIVAILDEAFAAIDKAKANAQQNLKNAKELFESYLQGVFENKGKMSELGLSRLKYDMIFEKDKKEILQSSNQKKPNSDKGEDWEEKTLGDIGKPSMCKRILKSQTSSIGDIPFYKIGTFGKNPDAFITKEIYNEFRTKYSFPKKGDILISASGTIGRRVRYDGEPAFFQDSNIVWIDNDEKQVLNDYLYVFYEFCDWQPSKGATISRLYNSNLTSIKIQFPKSHEDQKKVLKKINALSSETKKLEAIYQQKINDLEELKKSVLQKAFSGELTTLKELV